MAAHSTLQIHSASLLERAQVGAAERLWRHTDLEFILPKLRYGQASAIDADAIAEVAVTQDVRRTADGQRGASAAAR